jgi:hypothetical protein
MSQSDPDHMLTRDKAAAALSELGYPVTKTSLATLASRGGEGPTIVDLESERSIAGESC